jgi:hypothetical protein
MPRDRCKIDIKYLTHLYKLFAALFVSKFAKTANMPLKKMFFDKKIYIGLKKNFSMISILSKK